MYCQPGVAGSGGRPTKSLISSLLCLLQVDPTTTTHLQLKLVGGNIYCWCNRRQLQTVLQLMQFNIHSCGPKSSTPEIQTRFFHQQFYSPEPQENHGSPRQDVEQQGCLCLLLRLLQPLRVQQPAGAAWQGCVCLTHNCPIVSQLNTFFRIWGRALCCFVMWFEECLRKYTGPSFCFTHRRFPNSTRMGCC